MKLKRRRFDSSTEKKILIGMIVSTRYLKDISPLIDLSYFQNTFAQTVAEWVLEFYEAYEMAPFHNMQDIFTVEQDKQVMKPEEEEIISKLLTEISKKYQLDQGVNVPYLTDQTEKYFKRRELELTAGNLKVLLANGDIDGAEQQIEKYRKVQKLTSNWINPLDNDEITKTFLHTDETFFKFPGKLGDFLGEFERGWLVGVAGPYKRGKTWLAQEFAVIAMLSGLKVAFFSLEMTGVKMKERIYKRLTATGKEEGEICYPCFDCLHNQSGECEKEERTNNYILVDEEGEVPRYDPEMKYRPCTYCRDNNLQDYSPITWFETIERPKYNVVNVGKRLQAFQKRFNNNFRIKIYPKYTANINDILRDLEILEHTEDFMPDMIIVDHADILAPENKNISGVEKEDQSWMALAKLGGIKQALVIAPTQVTKEALESEQTRQRHTARWSGKLGHVDAMMAISQTPEEKEQGIQRISLMLHRHEEFFEEASCIILQNLNVGQAHLDSERQERRE